MPSSTPRPTRHTARHRTACALTGPAKIGAPLLLPLPLTHRSEPETVETYLIAPPKRSYQAATPYFSAQESTRCQVDLSPKTERSSQLQGFTPSTSSYRAPPLPAVHTAHPSMGLVPLQGFETTAGCPTAGQTNHRSGSSCTQWTHALAQATWVPPHPFCGSDLRAEALKSATEVCPVVRFAAVRPKPSLCGPSWGF
jgi:hypothetical protein